MKTTLPEDKKFGQRFTHNDANAVKAAITELDGNISNINSLNLWIPKDAVATKAALVTTYSAPAKNWAAMVLADGYVYINDGLGALEANWVNSGQKQFPVDVALKEDLFQKVSDYSVRFRKNKQLTYDPATSKLKVIGSDSVKPSDLEIFSIIVDGVYYTINGAVNTEQNISVADSHCQICIPKSLTNISLGLSDFVTFDDTIDHSSTHIKLAHIIYNDGLTSYIIKDYRNIYIGVRDKFISLETKLTRKGIFNGDIIFRMNKYLTYDPTSMKLKVIGSNSAFPSDPEIFTLKYDELYYRVVGLPGDERQLLGVSGNTQIYIPKSVSDPSNVTLSDLVIFIDAIDRSSTHIKLAHITYNDGITSNIIKDLRGIYNPIELERLKIDVHSSIDSYNFSQDVIVGGNIGEDGILASYPGRSALFFRLSKIGVANNISGCTILAYQWYSSMPEYISGTNSLGRTSTNTPPETASHCGLTILAEHTDIIIESIEDTTKSILVRGASLNNSIGENCFANGLRSELKILGFGNSFMRNSVHYLSAIAKGANVNLTVGNLYTGGTNLNDHLSAMINNSSDYVWNKYKEGVNTESLAYQTARYGLSSERWDVVILHQYTPWTQPFEPYLNEVIKKIIDILGYCPKFYLNSTWAGHEDYVQEQYGFATETLMWQYMLTANQIACEDSGIMLNSIIPTGTSIQNARTLSYADSYNRFVNSETDWHHLNPAGGFIAACTIYEKIIYPLNSIHCDATTFRILDSTSMPPTETIETGILVTNTNYLSMCKCVIDAIENPNVITNQ